MADQMHSVWRGRAIDADLAGQITDDGRVWRGRREESHLVGVADVDGRVWRGERNLCDLAGEVTADGQVWTGEQAKCDLLGEVGDEGRLWRGRGMSAEFVGEVDPPDQMLGGAGLLLLLDTTATRRSLAGVAVAAAMSATSTCTRQVGVAHSTGVAAMFSLDVNRNHAVMVKEGASDASSPEAVAEKFRQHRERHDRRRMVLVIEGSASWIQRYRSAVEGADCFVFCSDEKTLRQMDIPVIDRGWKPGDRQRGRLEDHL